MPNENQHWIPKFLVKNFTDIDGRVYCLNIQNDIRDQTATKVCRLPRGF